MKKILVIVLVLASQMHLVAQIARPYLHTLVDKLNRKVAPTVVFEMAGDSVRMEVLGHAKKFAIRRQERNYFMPGYEYKGIALIKDADTWKFNFQSIVLSKARFALNQEQKLCLFLGFNGPTGIYFTARPPYPSGCVITKEDTELQEILWSGNTTIVTEFKVLEREEYFFLKVANVGFKGFMNPVHGKRYKNHFKTDLERYLAHELLYFFVNKPLSKDLKEILAINENSKFPKGSPSHN